MSFTYGFMNSINGDRKYNAEQMSMLFDGILMDGVFSNVGGLFAVLPSEARNSVIVRPGRAWFNHTWFVNDEDYELFFDSHEEDRIDAVVIEVNHKNSVRASTIKVLRGTSSRPQLQNGPEIFQHPLAYVTITSDIIDASNIDCRVGKSDCPFSSGVMTQVNIDSLFELWDANFTTWFENIKNELTGDVEGHLQARITENRNLIDSHWAAYLGPLTKEVMGLPETAVPDDAFMYLAWPSDKYGVRVIVTNPDGTPLSNVLVNNITLPSGGQCRTDRNGVVTGLSANSSVNVSISAPSNGYLDYNYSISSGNVNLIKGIINEITLQVTRNMTTNYTFTSSRTIRLSRYVTSFDCSVLGGGYNGGAGTGNYARNDPPNNYARGGSGGSGGGMANASGLTPRSVNEDIVVTVGSVGGGISSFGDYLTSSGKPQASGGSGGFATPNQNLVLATPGSAPSVSFLYPPTSNIGGGGGGGGFSFSNASGVPTDGDGGGGSTNRAGAAGASGGGRGGKTSSSSNEEVGQPATGYGAGGGGGSGSNTTYSVAGGAGKSGLVGLVLHF